MNSSHSKMSSLSNLNKLMIAIILLGFLHVSTCNTLTGHSAFTTDLLAPLSDANNLSPKFVRDILSRQSDQTCTAGSPFIICPTPGKCCSASDNCQTNGCCPKIAETCGGRICAEPGTICCGNSGCRAGGVCKRSSGGQDVCCTATDDVACDAGYCCKAGYACSSGGLCQRIQTTTLRPSSISSSTSSTSRLSPTSNPSRTTSAIRPSSTSAEVCSIGTGNRARADETCKTTSTCTSMPASTPTGIGAWNWIKVEGVEDCVPVLDFFCVDDLFDQMCTSMCQGIRDQQNTNPERVISDRAILLHRREGRQAATGCSRMGCAQRVTFSGLYNNYFSMQCDEFPPASTMEGGGPTLTCISWYQNGLGGVYLRYFYDDLRLTENDPFVIRMDTCDFPSTPVSYPEGQQPPLPRRRQASGSLSMKGAEAPQWVRDPRHESEGYVLLPLEAAGTGNYTGTLALSNIDSLHNVCIIDGAGEMRWNNSGTWIGSKTDLQYQVQDDTQDLFVAARAPTSVSVSASFSATGSLPSSTPSHSASRAPLAPNAYALRALSSVVLGILYA